MKKTFFFAAALFLFAGALTARATITEDEKEIDAKFTQAHAFFLQAQPDKSGEIFKELADGENITLDVRLKAAALLADLLRWEYAQGKMNSAVFEDFKKIIAKLHPEFEKVKDGEGWQRFSAPKAAYLAETRKAIEEKKPVPAGPSPEGLKIPELAKAAQELEKENPIASVLLDEKLWALSQAGGAQDPALGAEIERAAFHINSSFWAGKKTYDYGDPPPLAAFTEVLAKYSQALQAKDPAAAEALLHPESPFKAAIMAPLQAGEITGMEFTDCSAPQWASAGGSVAVTCKSKGTRVVGGKPESGEGEKTVVFRKDKDLWRIEQI